MIDLQTATAAQGLMDLSPEDLEKKLAEIKLRKHTHTSFKTNELIRGLLSFFLSSDTLCELLDLSSDIQVFAAVALHPSFDLRAAAHLGRAWSTHHEPLWDFEDNLHPEVFSRFKSVFLAYAAVSLRSFWYFSACMESTNLEGLGYSEQKKLTARDNEKAFMDLLQSLEEGGFPLLELALTLLSDGGFSGSCVRNEETISICELAKNI